MSAALAPGASLPATYWDPLQVPMRLLCRRHGHRYRLDTLSPASARAFEKCPEAFRRRDLLGEKVPPNLSMTLGSVVGDALAHFFQGKIDGRPPDAKDLDDLVLELFEAKIAEAVLATDDDTEVGKSQCRAGVADYLEELAPSTTPISVERRASFRFCEGQEWSFICYFDLECAKQLPDLKFGKPRVKEIRAARDLQATAQTYMRWGRGQSGRVCFSHRTPRARGGSTLERRCRAAHPRATTRL